MMIMKMWSIFLSLYFFVASVESAEMHPLTYLSAMEEIASNPIKRQQLTQTLLKLYEQYSMSWYQGEMKELSAVNANQSTCFRDYGLILEALITGHAWPLQFVDASGKMPPGMSGGAMTWFGSYEMCNLISAQVNDQKIEGRYCNVRIPIEMNDPEIAVPFGLTLGMCVPNSCTTADVIKMAERIFYLPGLKVDYNYSYCYESHESLPKDSWFIVSVSVCVFVGALSVLGTLIDFCLYLRWQRVKAYSCINDLQNIITASEPDLSQDEASTKNSPVSSTVQGQSELFSEQSAYSEYGTYRAEFLQKHFLCGGFFLAFSLPYNIYKLWNAPAAQVRDEFGQLRAHPLAHLDGIRVLTMVWIMFAHVLIYQTYFSSNMLLFREQTYKDWKFMVVRNGSFSVDTFFFVSGLLSCYLLIPKYRSVRGCCKRFGFWLHFALHRFLRIAPTWFFITIIFTGLFPYLADGPMYPQHTQSNPEFVGCRTHWWAMFLNNWLYTDQPCMLWTWYLSNDYQFSVILAPLFITMIVCHWIFGVVFAVLLIISSSLAAFVVTYKNEFGPDPVPIIIFGKLYAAPYTRWGAYTIGMLAGWLLSEHPIQAERYSVTKRRVVSVISCLVASALTLSTIYGLHGHFSGSAPMSNLTASIYAAFSRIAYTIGIGLVICLCATSWTPVIRTILCFSGFRVLARLTFCAYIIHPILIMFFHYTLKETINVDYIYMTYLLFAVWTMSYMLAIFISSSTEVPIINLSKYSRKRQQIQK